MKQQTIKPTYIPITIFNFYDKMIEIMVSAVDSLSSINNIVKSEDNARFQNSKGPKYRFPSQINFNRCREEIASALNDFGN